MTTTVTNGPTLWDEQGIDMENMRRQAAFHLAYGGSSARLSQLRNGHPSRHTAYTSPNGPSASSRLEGHQEIYHIRTRYLSLKRQWETEERTDELKTALEDIISQMIDRGWDL